MNKQFSYETKVNVRLESIVLTDANSDKWLIYLIFLLWTLLWAYGHCRNIRKKPKNVKTSSFRSLQILSKSYQTMSKLVSETLMNAKLCLKHLIWLHDKVFCKDHAVLIEIGDRNNLIMLHIIRNKYIKNKLLIFIKKSYFTGKILFSSGILDFLVRFFFKIFRASSNLKFLECVKSKDNFFLIWIFSWPLRVNIMQRPIN